MGERGGKKGGGIWILGKLAGTGSIKLRKTLTSTTGKQNRTPEHWIYGMLLIVKHPTLAFPSQATRDARTAFSILFVLAVGIFLPSVKSVVDILSLSQSTVITILFLKPTYSLPTRPPSPNGSLHLSLPTIHPILLQ